MVFAIGQRWISESETHLGLGIIVGIEMRTVTLLFPASDEQRIYALDSAPLNRVQFQINDRITHHEGWQADILEAIEKQGIMFYRALRTDTQTEVIIKEIDLAHHITFSKPQERLFAAQIDRNEHFVTRYQALLNQQAQFQSSLRGLRGFRANLIPHQLHIAQEVSQRIAPRVLLADEVGLGKTLEAGMILQQQLLAGKIERALVIVPETLQHQWLVEMLRRFNLAFSLFDEERSADFAPTEEETHAINPFETESLILCALDWLVQQPQRVAQATEAGFDLLIVDEAHHLAWSENNPSRAYQIVECLTQAIPAVLLLTATPEQLGQESHFARLCLLDPDRFYDYQAFVQEQQYYQPVARAVNNLLSEQILSPAEKNHIAELLTEQDVEPLFKAIEAQSSDSPYARQELITQLIDRHGTSRLLFRNTRQGVKGFPHRIYHQITLPQPMQYANAIKVVGLVDDISIKVRLNPELIFQQLNADTPWWEFDPRVAWLIAFLKNQRDEKVLVICQHANTAIQLEQTLREKEAIRAAVFHEKQSIIERDRAAAYFAQQDGGAQVLLSSSIGSEGRNFQFACHLVLFGLPDTPDLLEQCIGRLDRIGQSRDIHIHVPCFADSAQVRLAQWYHEGLNAFEETCPMGATLFAKCGEKLHYFLQNMTALPDFERFIHQTQQLQQQLKQTLEQGRDRLLEYHSNGGEAAQQLANQIAQADASSELINFALNLFDIIGVEQEDLDAKTIVLSPTGHMLMPDFPGLKEEGVTVTFDRQLALVREDIEFLTWDHPMIRHGIDLLTSGDIGKTAVALLLNKGLPTGTLLLELIYVIETQAPKQLQLDRFLPPTPIRLLLDGNGTNIASQVSFSGLNKQLKPINKHVANKVVKMTKANIEKLLIKGTQLIPQYMQTIIDDAKQQAESTLGYEINRLLALKAVNKNIRQHEIDTLEQALEQSCQYIQQATWRLDSLRLIISNKE